jgi:PAS domain S-box-containing protein
MPLRESEARFREFADLAPAMLWVTEADTFCSFVSRGWCEFTGQTLEESLGFGWVNAVHPEDRSHAERVFLNANRQRVSFTNDYRLRRKDGAYRWVNAPGRPRFSPTGEFLGYIGSVIDVHERKQAEEALREREERYELVLAGTETAIWDWDVPAKRVVFSPRWKQMRGYAEHEVSDREEEWSSGIHPADRERVLAAVQAHFDGRTPVFAQEYRVRHKDGRWIWILDRGIARRDRSGRVIRMAGSETDITERKRAQHDVAMLLEEYRRKAGELEVLLQALPIGVFIARDPECRNIQMNDAGAALLRMPTGANVSKTAPGGEALPFRVMKDGRDVAGEDLPMQLAARTGSAVIGEEVEVVFQDGSTVELYEYAAPLFDSKGKVRGCVGVFVDITERKAAERKLREADRRKDEFLATLAHELRNPLAPLRTGLQLLDLSSEEASARPVREMMQRQLAQMVRLIDDLLDVSRISRGKIELRKEQVELAAVLLLALETSRPHIEERKHQLSVRLPSERVFLEADPVRLSQVFSNLLDNAAKYTEQGGRIEVSGRLEDGGVLVSVKDNGIGISRESLPKLFELFSQVRGALSHSHGGLGIGLSLVKGLVEMHGGSVSARSDGPGTGSEFLVRLPAKVEEVISPATRETPAQVAVSAAGMRILVVDDNLDAASTLSTLLELYGNTVRSAHDGEQAVHAADEFRPDVILLDIGLPKIDGHEACRRIRQQPSGSDISIVAITGWGQDEDRRRSSEAGFDSHLTKPVDPQILMGLLADLRGRSHTAREGAGNS